MIEDLNAYVSDNIIAYNNRVIPNSKPSLGIKASILKEIAKKYAREKEYTIFNELHIFHEEDMIHAYMIGYIKNIDDVYRFADIFIPSISNWAVCDGLVCNLKIVRKYREVFLNLVKKYKDSSNEYEKRFSLIMLLCYYVDDEYIDYIFNTIDEIECNTYYV
ncbi:MAG: DNA alkylation repair protein [Anaeroplasma sp.]